MSELTQSFSARRTARRCSVFTLLSLTACTLLPHVAEAATARVRWYPSDSTAVVRYDVYVRNAGEPYGVPAWSGNPAPGADGALEALVPFSAATAGANYFAAVAVGASSESPLSRELATGTPVACRIDSCTAKTTCDFGNLPDGTLCDVGNTDPCSAVCIDGTCGSTSGADALASEVVLDRLRFTTRAAGVKLSLKGKFATDAMLDLASTGAIFELRGPDGAVLYSASVGGASFTAAANGGRFRFHGTGQDADPAWNGLATLDFRQSGSRWIVTARAKSDALTEASQEPALTMVMRLGTTCLRRVDAECAQEATTAICR